MSTVLIVGASGVVGSSALERFLRDDDRDVIAISRREPDFDAPRPYRHLPLDLADPDAARGALAVDPDHVIHPGLLGGWWLSKTPVPRRTPDEAAR